MAGRAGAQYSAGQGGPRIRESLRRAHAGPTIASIAANAFEQAARGTNP
jgi:hypothetical protein